LVDGLQYNDLSDENLEAARRLALHPADAVPLLIEAISETASTRKGIAYALGLCGGADAVAALKTAATTDLHKPGWHEVLFALDLTGEPGRRVLKDFGESDPFIKRHAETVLGKSHSLQFGEENHPPLPKNLKLD
jgi:hypothetical protein